MPHPRCSEVGQFRILNGLAQGPGKRLHNFLNSPILGSHGRGVYRSTEASRSQKHAAAMAPSLKLPNQTFVRALSIEVALSACVCLLSPACSHKPPTPPQAPDSQKQEQGEEAEGEQTVPPPQPRKPPVRPKTSGKPSPEATSGHAVAFAGWKPSKDGIHDVLLLCDPGDNSMEGRLLHGWSAKPRELPLFFGKRRPHIVLLPAGAFTITGAIVVAAADKANSPPPYQAPVTAEGMPDLSQDFNSAWIGLCGATSGANILFYMGQKTPTVLRGFPRGPSAEADAGVVELITGGPDRIDSDSLAGRMGTADDGFGATNIGIRAGMESWLEQHDEGHWAVALDWFADEEKTREQQRIFFSRLAAAVHSGGGAILCLWPGTEYSDSSAADEAANPTSADHSPPRDTTEASSPSRRSASPSSDSSPPDPLPEADFPSLPPEPSASRPTLPARAASGPTESQAIDQARQQLNSARSRLERNDPARAFTHVTRAVALLRQHGGDGNEAKALLAEALALSKEIESRLPPPSGQPFDKRTLFQ